MCRKNKSLHGTLASCSQLLHNRIIVNWFSEDFLIASLIWGSVASGYLIYGWKQKAALPLAGGAVMMLVSCFMPALSMSLICIVTMVGVYWLAKRGY